MKTTVFVCIPAVPRRDMVLLRLGYKKSTVDISQKQSTFLEKAITQGLALCKPQGILGRCGIAEHAEEYIRLKSGDYLYSKSLARFLEHSDEVMLLAATVGREVVEAAQLEISQGEASLGVVLDAVASQTADAAAAWIMDFVGRLVQREGKKVTKNRYSPGYGDFALSNQKVLFELLGLHKLGLCLTEKYMLVPEKSTIAIAGIERVGSDE